MKVVLFCGGLGMRLRDYSDQVPKPMVPIGYRPVLWHVMRYYAHFGHKDFILCLGYKADAIKNYFINYDERISNDFVLSGDGRTVDLLSSDIHDWTITFVDTGIQANIGQRLKAVEPYLRGEEVFLANYADGLTDFPLPRLTDGFLQKGCVGSFLCVRPSQSFHAVSLSEDDRVDGIKDLGSIDMWLNGGYFVFRREIFEYIGPGEELVHEPFARLIEERRLGAVKYDGFWACMDTFKDKEELDKLYASGKAPWQPWNRNESSGGQGGC